MPDLASRCSLQTPSLDLELALASLSPLDRREYSLIAKGICLQGEK